MYEEFYQGWVYFFDFSNFAKLNVGDKKLNIGDIPVG